LKQFSNLYIFFKIIQKYYNNKEKLLNKIENLFLKGNLRNPKVEVSLDLIQEIVKELKK